MIYVHIGQLVVCNTIGDKSSGHRGLLTRICNTEEEIKLGWGNDYGEVSGVKCNLHNCVAIERPFKLKLYAHQVAHDKYEEGRDIDKYDWMSIDIVQNTATMLAKVFRGKADCSSCGVVQYDDLVLVPYLTDEDIAFIKRAYPFVTVSKPNDILYNL